MASEPKPCGCRIDKRVQFYLHGHQYLQRDDCKYPAALERIAELEHQLAAERERVIEECAQLVMRVGFSAASYHIRRLAEKPVENPKCKI